MNAGGKAMTKSGLIEKVAERTPHISKKDTEIVVNTIFDAMTEALKLGERIEIGLESGPQVFTCVRGATELRAGQGAVPLAAGSTAVLFADAGPARIASSTGGRVLRAWVGD